jgi:hypothetical protein
MFDSAHATWYEIPRYDFCDPAVQGLLDVIVKLRAATGLLQRYWVEFNLRLEESTAPYELQILTRRISAEFALIPLANVESVEVMQKSHLQG